jgi:hypothetical protein
MQTLWRTRGTYFWSLFRQNNRIRAYNEPLHEWLASKTNEDMQREYDDGSPRFLRHPPTRHHYFSEYPLLAEGGVPLFSKTMAFGNFMLTEFDEDPPLEAYLRSLVNYAMEHGQQAYFKFTRGGCRAGFIRRKLAGTHIYLNRPPAEICQSYRSYGPGSYFTTALTYVVMRYVDYPFCRAAVEILRNAGPFDDVSIHELLNDDPTVMIPAAARLTAYQIAILTATFWLAYLMEGLAVADFVIDTERLGCDEKYRKSTEDRLSKSFGCGALTEYHAGPCEVDFTTYAGELQQILASDDRLRSRAMVNPEAITGLGASSRRLLEKVL